MRRDTIPLIYRMVGAVRETGDGPELLDTSQNRLRKGDIVKLSINRLKGSGKGFAKNPFDRGSPEIHIEFDQPSARRFKGKDMWMEIKDDEYSIGGYIVAKPCSLPEEKEHEIEDHYSSPGRKEPIEWEGTPQSRTDEETERRNRVFSEEDIRGDKNDLL